MTQLFGLHWSNKNHTRDDDARHIIGSDGPVTILHMQAGEGWYERLRKDSPRRLIHVRIYREWWEDESPELLAKWAARELAYLWHDPRALVSPANEQNIELKGRSIHDVRKGAERRALYRKIALWNMDFWHHLDNAIPDRRALALWSALADGHDAEPGVPDSEYLIPEMREALARVDVIASHPYADLKSRPHSGATGAEAWWGMLRAWRPAGVAGPHDPGGLLEQCRKPHFVSETGTFTHDQTRDAAQVAREFSAMLSVAQADRQTLGITPFIWSSGPEHGHNVIAGNDALVLRLRSLPRFSTSAAVPIARKPDQPGEPPEVPPMPDAIYIVQPGDTLSRIGAMFGIPWRELAAANDIAAPWVIRVGQHLKLPGVKRCSPGGKPAPVPSGRAFEWVEGRADDTVHVWSSRHPVRFLIMHDPVAGSPAGLLRYLRQNDRGVSYSEVIVPGNPPQVHVLVHGADQRVGHAGYGEAVDVTTGKGYGRTREINLNDASWGICIYKHKDDGGPFSPDLYAAAVRLAAERAKQFDVPVPNILSHAEVDPGRRSDPRGLDMVRFRADVAALLS